MKVIVEEVKIQVLVNDEGIQLLEVGRPGPMGPKQIHVGTNPPANPSIGDLWVDTN